MLINTSKHATETVVPFYVLVSADNDLDPMKDPWNKPQLDQYTKLMRLYNINLLISVR